MKSLSVICPVYQEEEVIAFFYEELSAVLSSLADSYESTVLFVVDRGKDSTLDILKRLAEHDPSVRVLALSSRFGHQMSLVAGMDHCNSDAVIMLDSDLQHPPSLIHDMLKEFEKGYDIVYTVRQDTPAISVFKRITSRLFYRCINRMSEVPINESAADFRLMSRRILEIFQNDIRERDQFLRGLFGWVGFKTIGIPFEVGKRKAGKSKYSLAQMTTFGISGVVSFSKSPLIAATVVGFVFAAFGFINAAVTFVQYLVFGHFPSGWATIVVLLSIFSGTQLIFLGVIGQYIGAIFDEVKGRPHYLIEEKINFEGK
jgi:glycosyltransferase involved in cell wall biosynthesis